MPDAIREAIMRTCSERLSPDGVAVISFNVLPGWRMFQIVRDSLILHAGDEKDYKTRSARTRQMFELMAKIAPEKGSYGAIWRYEARAMADRPDFYLAHEIFEEDNAPCTFRSFAETAALHGLAYLAETRLNANIPESGPPETAKAIRELAGDDQIAAEQYIDVIRGTTFRESLLIPAARAPQIHRALDGERLATLHFIAPLDLRVAAPADAGELVLENDDGHVIATKDPCLSAALRMLVDNTPRSSSFSELAAANAATPEQRSKLTALFMHLLVQGALESSCEPVLCAVRPGDIPAAWPLVISDAAAGAEHSATLRHAPFPVTPIVRFLMPMLDGRHSRAEMTQALVRLAQSGELTIANDKGPITDVEQLRGVCAAKVDREIAQLARIGVLLDA